MIAGTAAPTRLPAAHLLLAVLVMAIWGSNFVVIKYALGALPPLLLAALRFTLAAFPLILFVPRPRASWSNLAAYGLLIGVGQFGILFIAMRGDITPGLASLVVQAQVGFTIMLAVLLTGERVRPGQLAALGVAAAGIVLIALAGGGSATPRGLLLVLFAALCWAGGNMVGRRAGRVPMLAYVVWSSLFAAPALVGLALLVEGPGSLAAGLARADALTWAAVLWQAVGNSIFGYGIWSWLLSQHPAATVAPTALLVPVFGLGTSALVLGEALQPWKLVAACLVLIGLTFGLLGRRRAGALRAPAA